MQNKIFAAEKSRLKGKKNEDAANRDGMAGMVSEIRADIKALAKYVRSQQPGQPQDTAAIDKAKEEMREVARQSEIYHNEVDKLRGELTELSELITQTKAEIAALSPDKKKKDGLDSVSLELDGIVTATESATQGILDAAEKIDTVASNIAATSQNNAVLTGFASELTETVMKIYECCNFQDLTGQRISKAVKTLKFVDEKVHNMINIWGEDSISKLADEVKKKRQGDERLLNGPVSDDTKIGQDEIDRLFD